MDLDAAVEALAPARDSLADLTIDAACGFGHGAIEFPHITIKGSLGDLKNFVHIRNLCLPWVFVVGFSPSQGKSLLHPLPRSLESLTLTDHLHRHEQWNWDAEGRYGEYDSDDNDDPCARTATVSQALENLDRELLPDLRTIVLAWHPEDDEMDDDLKQEIENMGVSRGIQVSWRY